MMECTGLHPPPALYAMDHDLLCPAHRFSVPVTQAASETTIFPSETPG